MENFIPQLCLFKDPTGKTFKLFSTTLVPNTCYLTGKVEIGLPDGFVGIPENLYVMLHIKTRSDADFCLQVITPHFHGMDDLKIADKWGITAFVLLDGKVVGSNHVKVDEALPWPPGLVIKPVPLPLKLEQPIPWPFFDDDVIPWPFIQQFRPHLKESVKNYDYESLYLTNAISHPEFSKKYHRVEFHFQMDDKEIEGKGKIILDPNECELNHFGDREKCTKMQLDSKEIMVVSIKMGDPLELGRRIFDVQIGEVHHPDSLFLVLQKEDFRIAFFVIYPEDIPSRMVIPLFNMDR